MKKQFLVTSILAIFALPASAENFYVLGDVGKGKIEVSFGDVTASKTDTTYSLGGGYNFNKTFAFEVSYRDLSSISSHEEDVNFSSTTKSDITALQASVIAKFPVSEVVDVYGRLGFGRLKLKSSYVENDDGDIYSDSASDSKNKALVGIGASYALNKEFSLRAEYSKFSKFDHVTLSALTLGATYNF